MTQLSDETLPLPCSTTFDFVGSRVERHIGLAWGLIVRSVGFAKGFTGGIRALRSGEVDEYTEVLEQARRHALDRLVQNATAMGANAVLMMRYDSAEIGDTMSEIVAYGTAAVIERAA